MSGPKGLNYSVVNMTLDAGKGDVELKNAPLQLNVVEKITAVRHCNNRDVWVIAHDWDNKAKWIRSLERLTKEVLPALPSLEPVKQ